MGLTKAQKAEREQAQKRSEATKRGWETKRAKKIMYSDAKPNTADVAVNYMQNETYKHEIKFYPTEGKNAGENDKPGQITTQAERNESLSRRLNSEISRLYSKMSEKIGGSLGEDSNKDLKESSLRILGALQATETNLNGSLKMIEELHKLQEEML